MSPTPVRLASTLAGALTCALALTACSGAEEQEPTAEPTPSASPTPSSLDEVDVAALPVDRTSFCDAVDPEAVEAALGGPVTDTSHYGNGEEAQLATGVRDVAHENSCTFISGDGVRARSWVFVPPVTPDQARDLVADAESTDGCQPLDGSSGYGRPSTALVCEREGQQRTTTEVSYRGLVGDAWLSCSLQVPRQASPGRAELVERADAWCLEAATAAAT